jgi:predicted RNA binding protein YcfA (HicA-like mRNA interferase family)
MPKLYSSEYIVKILLRIGFQCISQKGSLAKFRKGTNPVLTVIVPMSKKEIPFGTFRSILRQANLTIQDFNKQEK